MLPQYEHTQKGSRLIWGIAVFLLFDLIGVEAVVYVLAGRGSNAMPQNQLLLIMLLIPLIPGVILGWAFLMMSSLTVSINREFIRLRFGGGMWKKTIPLDQIVKCNPVQNTFANGWGIRYIGKGCWLYNIAGLDALEIHLDNGKSVRIGTDEPEKLAHAICKAIGKSSQ